LPKVNVEPNFQLVTKNPFYFRTTMQTTEQELLKEIARVAGLINRKKQEQTQPKPASCSKTFTQPTSANATLPLKNGKNLTYVRPGTAQPPTTQISKTNPPTSAPKIPPNPSNANNASNNGVLNNSKSTDFFPFAS
jgi:hypothetical protein